MHGGHFHKIVLKLRMRVGGGLRSHLTSLHFNLLTKEEINLLYWEIKNCLKPRGVHRSQIRAAEAEQLLQLWLKFPF